LMTSRIVLAPVDGNHLHLRQAAISEPRPPKNAPCRLPTTRTTSSSAIANVKLISEAPWEIMDLYVFELADGPLCNPGRPAQVLTH
jgi:hypothetical protein